ncbi:Beta-lactamase [Acidisarcina polymorpha]|uniref:beta-lactamase n=2 Tax=Acidisarcina polymorpha TaxID=2211140 RepID=A0A2Z5FTD0_9BACT|nr:Beta-lactamase [Acidisarcina polymorpha]
MDGQSGLAFGHRINDLFPMCSTFKVLAVAAALAQVDSKRLDLRQTLSINPEDLLKYAPVTSQHLGLPGMTLGDLCEAALTLSDNTAANLILRSIGGPVQVTRFARLLDDSITRLDRAEPTLNEATPGDRRDTTTPLAMAKDLRKLFCGSVLSGASRSLLKEWMIACKTGDKKIRSGFSKSFVIADKTGSGDHNTSNDVAVIWPASNQSPLILTV